MVCGNPLKIINIHDIEIDEYFEKYFYNITNSLTLDINVEPQYLHADDTEQVDASDYYEDVFNYFNPNPVEIIDDDTTNYIDDNHYPECDRHLLDYGDCICLELLLTKHLDLTLPDPSELQDLDLAR